MKARLRSLLPLLATRRGAERATLLLALPLVALGYAQHFYPGPGGRVWFADSVSFQYYAISHSLGHSPGYPQYLALLRLIARVPFGQAWQRVDFLSSLCAALALGAYYALCRVLGLRIVHAACAVLVLALSRNVFMQATEAEVYALNLLWVLTCVALFVWYANTRRRAVLLGFFVAYGCSLGHHPTMVLLVPPVLICVVRHHRGMLLDPLTYAFAALAIAIGLLQYTYTYALFTDRTLSYRWIEYKEYNLANFIDFTTGSAFRKLMFSQPLAVVWRDKVPQLLGFANAQNSIVFPLLGLCGLAAWPQFSGSSRTLLLGCIAAYAVWALGYDVADIEVFTTPLWALCYVGVVPGLQALLRRDARSSAAAVCVLTLIAFRYAVMQTGDYHPVNERLAVANEFIAKMPPGATLVSYKLEGNGTFPMLWRYLEASGDSGPFHVARSVKHCAPDVYFAEGARGSIRMRNYRERRVARLDLSTQDLFVMECDPTP